MSQFRRLSRLRSNDKVTVLIPLVCLAAVCHVGILIYGITRHFPNVDEAAHLPAGVSHWVFGNFDLYRVNPPLVRTVCCLLSSFRAEQHFDWTLAMCEVGRRPEFAVGTDYISQKKLDAVTEYFIPRLVAIIFSLVAFLTLILWSVRTLGARSTVAIAFFWSFSPNVLAHAQTIVPDVGMVATFCVCGYASFHYLMRPNIFSAMFAGITLGIAALSKLTMLTLFLSIPATVCLLWWMLERPSRTMKLVCIDLALIWAIALTVINFGYVGENSLVALGDYEFCSETLGGDGARPGNPSNRFADTFVGRLPLPLPQNYVRGIDYLKWEVERKKWSFLMGEWKFGSWPHYYVMTTLFKTPEPTLIAVAFGLILFFRCWYQRKIGVEVISFVALLGIPALAAFASVSLQGGFNHHHRYVLMIYPVMFVLAAFPASNYIEARWPKIVTSLLCVWMVIASLSVSPHYLSYFNTISGGPNNGWKLLGFSNIDWGQDLLFVDQWIKEHPECRPLRFELDYFGIT